MVSLGNSEMHYLNDSVKINYVFSCGTVVDNIFRELGQFRFILLRSALFSVQYNILQCKFTHFNT